MPIPARLEHLFNMCFCVAAMQSRLSTTKVDHNCCTASIVGSGGTVPPCWGLRHAGVSTMLGSPPCWGLHHAGVHHLHTESDFRHPYLVKLPCTQGAAAAGAYLAGMHHLLANIDPPEALEEPQDGQVQPLS